MEEGEASRLGDEPIPGIVHGGPGAAVRVGGPVVGDPAQVHDVGVAHEDHANAGDTGDLVGPLCAGLHALIRSSPQPVAQTVRDPQQAQNGRDREEEHEGGADQDLFGEPGSVLDQIEDHQPDVKGHEYRHGGQEHPLGDRLEHLPGQGHLGRGHGEDLELVQPVVEVSGIALLLQGPEIGLLPGVLTGGGPGPAGGCLGPQGGHEEGVVVPDHPEDVDDMVAAQELQVLLEGDEPRAVRV